MNAILRNTIAILVLAFGTLAFSVIGLHSNANATPPNSAEGLWCWGFTGTRVPFGRGDSRGSLNTSSSLTFASGTGTLSATKFSGALNGTVGATTPAAGLFTTIGASDNVTVSAAGKGFKVKEGSNAKMGTATLSSGWVNVSNTSVGATSRIFVTGQTTTGALYVKSRVNGTSFAIYSTDNADAGDAAYIIVDPAP